MLLLPVFALSSCVEEEDESLEEDIEYLEEEIRVLKADLDSAHEELEEYDAKFESFEAVKKKAESLDEKINELEEAQKENEGLEEQLREERKKFDEYQKKYEAKVRTEAVGESFATLDVDGQTLKEVKIRFLSETVIKIEHASGLATLDASTAPEDWKKRFFLRSKEEVTARAAELAAYLNPVSEPDPDAAPEPKRRLSDYQVIRQQRAAEEEALKNLDGKVQDAFVTVGGEREKGNGFFVLDGITTYLYTEAQLLENNPALAIVDRNGKQWKSFGALEVVEGKNLVRLAVTESVETALRIYPSNKELNQHARLVTLSLGDDGVALSKLDTRFRLDEEGGYVFSATGMKTARGGAVVTSEGEVLAIVTEPLVVRSDVLGKQRSTRRVQVGATQLDRLSGWEKTSMKAFLRASRKLADFDSTSRLLHTLSTLKRGSAGFTLSTRVTSTQTAQDILEADGNQALVKRFLDLNKALSTTKTRISDRDVNAKLRSVYQDALNQARKQSLEKREFSSYHWPDAEVSLKFREEALTSLKAAVSALN